MLNIFALYYLYPVLMVIPSEKYQYTNLIILCPRLWTAQANKMSEVIADSSGGSGSQLTSFLSQ